MKGKSRKRTKKEYKIEKEQKQKKRQNLSELQESAKKVPCRNHYDNIRRQCVGKITLGANARKK